ncbi:MAG: hypothetical protein ACP5I6_03510 [Caldisphaera sp.]|jgi:hypothetical protein|nr:hypothetical protein [Caldisphaera sp.]PMP60977.1 MAG: hypothetical protein C0201_01300 [Caldisphaera sp.]
MISYQKLIRFISGNPSYSYIEDVKNNILEIFFNTPSVQEASESDENKEQGRVMHIILKKVKNDELDIVSASIEGENYSRELPKDEIKWWLDIIDKFVDG